LSDLLKDDYPILFEGLHSCYFLDHPKLKDRVKIIRCHNVEHDYYYSLATKTPTWSLRHYFKMEASKLKRFEKVLFEANQIAAISESDFKYFQKEYGNTFLMPPCHPNDEVKIKEGKGDFILYHGNLSVQENDEAARFIVEKIAPFIKFPFVIAGKNPSKSLRELASQVQNIQIISNPREEQLNQLISDAHINLLPTFQATGFKLKMLNALFNGRFCIGTPQLTEGTGLEKLCITAEDELKMISEINNCLSTEFSAEIVKARKNKLNDCFSNQLSVSKLVDLI
jgi:glycosyltransferase involved in cell wall biosynthesis